MTASPRLVLGKTLREHIGGRWALSWQIYVLNIPFNFLAISTSIRVQPVGLGWIEWAGVALLGLLAIALGFLAAEFTVLRHRREHPVHIGTVAAVGAVTGVFRGAVVVAASSWWGLQPFGVDELVNRMLAGGLVGAVALPVAALTFSIVTTYRQSRRDLIEERIGFERERLVQEGDVEVLRRALVKSARAEMTATLETVSHADPRTVSEAIRATSHRMWEPERATESREDMRIRDVLWTALRSRPLPVIPAVLVWGLTAVGTLVAALGPVRGLVNLAYALLALWLSLTIANVWIRRRPGQWVIATGAMLVVAYLTTSPLSYILFDPRPLATALPIMVMNAIWLPTVVLLAAIAASAVESGEVVLQRLSENVTAADIRRRAVEAERDDILRDIAAQIHGTAHSPMVAASGLLSSHDTAEREKFLEYVGQAVAQLDARERPADLRTRMASVGIPWDGLVDVHVDVAADVPSSSQATLRLIERIVEEAIANAYRHGGASRVDVALEVDSGVIVVRAHDDGRGLSPSPGSGLGCRLFETAAPGNWTLNNHFSGGAELVVHVTA